MKLDDNDFKAIAKSRVNRAESKHQLYWMLGIILALLSGGYLLGYSPLAWVLVAGGFIGGWWVNNEMCKKYNAMTSKLITEYKEGERE